jgi:hypothetical protein
MSETYDVAVVGAGLAGMSAAVFAANRGLRVVQVGNAGALLFSSGLLDLLGVHRSRRGAGATPAGLASRPTYPATLCEAWLRECAPFGELVAALTRRARYTAPGERNHEVMTGVGTIGDPPPAPAACMARRPPPWAHPACWRLSCAVQRSPRRGRAARWPGCTLRLALWPPGSPGKSTLPTRAALEERDARVVDYPPTPRRRARGTCRRCSIMTDWPRLP